MAFAEACLNDGKLFDLRNSTWNRRQIALMADVPTVYHHIPKRLRSSEATIPALLLASGRTAVQAPSTTAAHWTCPTLHTRRQDV